MKKLKKNGYQLRVTMKYNTVRNFFTKFNESSILLFLIYIILKMS